MFKKEKQNVGGGPTVLRNFSSHRSIMAAPQINVLNKLKFEIQTYIDLSDELRRDLSFDLNKGRFTLCLC